MSTKPSDKWKYLGVNINGEDKLKLDGDISVELSRLERAGLKPQQKLFALWTCLIPRPFHLVSLGLMYLGRLKKMDSTIRAMARK